MHNHRVPDMHTLAKYAWVSNVQIFNMHNQVQSDMHAPIFMKIRNMHIQAIADMHIF